MKKKDEHFVNFVLVLIILFLIHLIFFSGALLDPVFGQECTDGTCDKAKVLPQFQVNWRSADTTDGRKNPAVVRMEHDDYKGRGYFTGFFVVAPNALRMNIVVTAAHCFEGPGETRVFLSDGRIFKGEILELDHIWDVAIVRVEGENIPAMRLATEPPVRGDPICAYGYGWVGKQYARMCGKALGYTLFKGQNAANTLKCSFVSRDGDSGGPMVNNRCEVVAVISCADDDQSGTHGTWAARIKVIVDGAIARKINQVDFVKKEDIGKLPLLPIQQVAPPVAEAGAVDERVKLAEKKPREKHHEEGTKSADAKAPSTGLGLPEGLMHGDVASSALAIAIPTIVTLLGVGLTGGVGWGGWVALRKALSVYRRINKKNRRSVDSSADSFSTLPRDARETQQLLQLAELEGRSPLFDALVGRLVFDELNDAIDGDRPEKDFAIQFKETVLRRFNEIAPISVIKEMSSNENQGGEK